MKKTMLTYKTLDRLEELVNPETLTAEQIKDIEYYAYVANMVECDHPNITAWGRFCHLMKDRMGMDLESLEAAPGTGTRRRTRGDHQHPENH